MSPSLLSLGHLYRPRKWSFSDARFDSQQYRYVCFRWFVRDGVPPGSCAYAHAPSQSQPDRCLRQSRRTPPPSPAGAQRGARERAQRDHPEALRFPLAHAGGNKTQTPRFTSWGLFFLYFLSNLPTITTIYLFGNSIHYCIDLIVSERSFE